MVDLNDLIAHDRLHRDGTGVAGNLWSHYVSVRGPRRDRESVFHILVVASSHSGAHY